MREKKLTFGCFSVCSWCFWCFSVKKIRCFFAVGELKTTKYCLRTKNSIVFYVKLTLEIKGNPTRTFKWKDLLFTSFYFHKDIHKFPTTLSKSFISSKNKTSIRKLMKLVQKGTFIGKLLFFAFASWW